MAQQPSTELAKINPVKFTYSTIAVTEWRYCLVIITPLSGCHNSVFFMGVVPVVPWTIILLWQLSIMTTWRLSESLDEKVTSQIASVLYQCHSVELIFRFFTLGSIISTVSASMWEYRLFARMCSNPIIVYGCCWSYDLCLYIHTCSIGHVAYGRVKIQCYLLTTTLCLV